VLFQDFVATMAGLWHLPIRRDAVVPAVQGQKIDVQTISISAFHTVAIFGSFGLSLPVGHHDFKQVSPSAVASSAVQWRFQPSSPRECFMNLTISGHHLEVPALRGYAQQLDRITRHFDQVVDAESC
jgi:hypothetical protein